MALCGHFLFLYSAQHDYQFHLASLKELVRIAREVRVFPLLALGGVPSPHVDPCSEELASLGLDVSRHHVPYEFQRGGNMMLRVIRGHDA